MGKGYRGQCVIRKLAVLVLCLLASIPVWAQKTVYQYIDQNGAMMFSDTPPSHTHDYLEIELPESKPVDSETAKARREDIVSTTERLQADRLLREQSRKNEIDKPLEPSPPPVIIVERERPYFPYSYRPLRKQSNYPPLRQEIPLSPRQEARQRMQVPAGLPPMNGGVK